MPYENEKIRIERKTVYTRPIPARKMAMVKKQVDMRKHNDEAADLEYWLSRPVKERLDAVTRLRAQVLKPGERLDKTHVVKNKMKR